MAVSITRVLPGMLALLIGVAGWFYLFYSRAASNLAGVEDQRLNLRRMSFRRFGAVVMLILAVLIAVGSYGYDLEKPTAGFFVLWMCVIALLMVVVILAFVDLRLTVKLRDSLRRQRKERT
jgi:uncharacterized protein YacL